MSVTVDQAKLESLGLAQQKPRVAKKEMGQEDFLKLMTTQLQNQDPMKPMENGDFLAQIAQFSAVDGIGKLQESFQTLAGSLHSNQAFQASNIIGKNVMVPSDHGVYFGDDFGEDTVMIAALEFDTGADEVSVNITDSAGQIIRTISLGSQESGRVEFAWDGNNDNGEPMDAGVYGFEALATVNGQKVGVDTLALVPVDSVSLGKNQSEINLNLVGLGEIGFSSVRDIR